jgi:hypothetical protein
MEKGVQLVDKIEIESRLSEGKQKISGKIISASVYLM